MNPCVVREGEIRENVYVRHLMALGNNHEKRLRGNSTLRALPYLGEMFDQRLRDAQYTTLDDIVRGFTGYPPLTAIEIEMMLVRLCQNPSRETCQQQSEGEDPYHVSDCNQCLFNSILDLLKESHRRRNRWRQLQFSVRPNVPNAIHVPYRERGDNQNVRTCACYQTEGDCRLHRCRWTPPNLTNSPVAANGACTPRWGEGFRGDTLPNRPRADQRTNVVGNVPNVRFLNGLPYVRRYRILGGRRPRVPVLRAPPPGQIRAGHPPRRRRGRGRRQLSGGAKYIGSGEHIRDIKHELKYEELYQPPDVVTRRDFNHMAQEYNKNLIKKKQRSCTSSTHCSVLQWFEPEYVGKWKCMMRPYTMFEDSGWW